MFKVLSRLREKVTTAYIEEIYLTNTNIQKYKHEVAVATAHQRASQAKEVKALLIGQLLYRDQVLRRMVSFYELQFRNLSRIKITASTPSSITNQLEKQQGEIASVHNFLGAFAQALQQPDSYPSSELVLQNFSLRSFKEPMVIKLDGIKVDSGPR